MRVGCDCSVSLSYLTCLYLNGLIVSSSFTYRLLISVLVQSLNLFVLFLFTNVFAIKFEGIYNVTVLSSHSKVDKTNGSLMKIKSIAKCCPRSILQYF